MAMFGPGPAGPEPRVAEISVSWRLSALPARLGTVAALGLLLAVVFARPALLLLATPTVVVLAVVVRRGARPDSLRLSVRLSEPRCVEGDEVRLDLQVRSPELLGQLSASLELTPTLAVVGVPHAGRFAARSADFGWTIRAERWGRTQVGPVRLSVRTLGLGWVATVSVSPERLTVLPPRRPARDLAVPPHLRARLGAHVGRRPGAGVEFSGIRDYAPGDPVRRVNWPASSRLRSLVVNEAAGEHAADVVAFVDTTSDVRTGSSATLDDAVRGAAGVAQAYLGQADRVGVVGFGARLRWLAPDLGMRQYYRIMDHVLSSTVDGGFVAPELSRLPRPILPPGCLVYLFSPLLDNRVVDAIADLRGRGHPVVVVDVLRSEPAADQGSVDQLALQIWRLQREALLYGLRQMGTVVLPWEPGGVMAERVRLQPLLGGNR